MVASRNPSMNGKLGTLAGVFTPSILTILGIILFLRMGWVVGNGGLLRTLLIVALATTVSVLTSISLAAVASNIEVRGGGDYYVISRTLGVEFGGALGVVLFAAQSISVAFYAIGFGEATAALLGWESQLAVQVIAAAAVLFLFLFAWAGADVASRLQFVIMAILVAALVSFYLGAIGAFDSTILSESWTPPPDAPGFWVVFAIFFPAVTGFTQGVSMSGDLRDPGKSLPVGTFSAVGLSTIVYLTVAVLLAASTPLPMLVDDTGQAMREVAIMAAFVSLGVIAATLSSAMASLLGAPRILQALAADRIFPFLHWFAKGQGPANNPRRAVVLTLVIAIATIGLGSLNVIAPVVSMFFLISYGLLNYATFYEARAASPSFRPRFRFFDKRLSLVGAVLCGVIMIAINPIAGAAAIVVLFLVYLYLSRRSGPGLWVDATPSHHFQRAVESIRALDGAPEHPRYWRPQILVFSADPERRGRLLEFSAWLEGESGFTAAFRIVVGEGALKRRETAEMQEELREEIEQLGLDVQARAVLAADGMAALPVIAQSFGLGRLRANTVLFGWPESPERERLARYVGALQDVARLGMNVVSLSTDELRWGQLSTVRRRSRRIDVWWTDNDSGRLALMAAYLFTRTREWGRATIRLLTPVEGSGASERTALEEMLDDARIDAEVFIMETPTEDDLVSAAAESTMLLLPMRIREGTIVDPFGGQMTSLVVRLPMTAGIMAGAPISLETGPDTGMATRLAEAELDADHATARLRALEQQLKRAEADVAEIQDRPVTNNDTVLEELDEAERKLERVHRRTLSARVRVDSTQAALEALREQLR